MFKRILKQLHMQIICAHYAHLPQDIQHINNCFYNIIIVVVVVVTVTVAVAAVTIVNCTVGNQQPTNLMYNKAQIHSLTPS